VLTRDELQEIQIPRNLDEGIIHVVYRACLVAPRTVMDILRRTMKTHMVQRKFEVSHKGRDLQRKTLEYDGVLSELNQTKEILSELKAQNEQMQRTISAKDEDVLQITASYQEKVRLMCVCGVCGVCGVCALCDVSCVVCLLLFIFNKTIRVTMTLIEIRHW
jgi:hypothetical protein